MDEVEDVDWEDAEVGDEEDDDEDVPDDDEDEDVGESRS